MFPEFSSGEYRSLHMESGPSMMPLHLQWIDNVLTISNGNSFPLMVVLLTDIFEPLLGKSVQTAPQFRPPFTGFGIDFIISSGKTI